MKIFIGTLCIVGMILSSSVSAQTLKEFGNTMLYFYLTPSEASFSKFQIAADHFRSELVGAENGAALLTSVMIARISEKNGWAIADGAFSTTAKEILDGQSELAKYIADDSKVDSTKLDVWWTSFFGTGDNRYLENIFRYAGLELPKGDISGMMVIGAATWSFKSNCQQHKRVLEFAKQKLSSPGITESQITFLKECISSAQQSDIEQNSLSGDGDKAPSRRD